MSMPKMNFNIRGKNIGQGHPPYIIAEMACAHDGDPDKAIALIDAAAEAGVDAVQLQLFRADQQVLPDHELYPLLTRIQFTQKQWEEIYSHARKTPLAVFGFLYDVPSLELALSLGIDGIKLSSADLSNPEMLAGAARSGLPITLGTGASTLDEIFTALQHIRRCNNDTIILMHGVQNFPTAITDAHLNKIKLLQHIFQLPVGYQDHTDADLEFSKNIDLIAVGLGACIIEKHVTLRRSEKGTDYQASLEPHELTAFTRHIRLAAEAMGSNLILPLTDSEHRYRQFQKKSIVAAEHLLKNQAISRNDILFIRNGEQGLSPEHFALLNGKKLLRDIRQHEAVSLADIA